jgi:hypothetical protein
MAAAGDRNVLVHSGYPAQPALEGGVLDEPQIRQIPVCPLEKRCDLGWLPVAIDQHIGQTGMVKPSAGRRRHSLMRLEASHADPELRVVAVRWE